MRPSGSIRETRSPQHISHRTTDLLPQQNVDGDQMEEGLGFLPVHLGLLLRERERFPEPLLVFALCSRGCRWGMGPVSAAQDLGGRLAGREEGTERWLLVPLAAYAPAPLPSPRLPISGTGSPGTCTCWVVGEAGVKDRLLAWATSPSPWNITATPLPAQC